MFRRLYRASIWHSSAIPAHERKYAIPLKRVVFPVYDIAVIYVGLFGLIAGFRAINEEFPSTASTVMYTVLTAAGFVCLVSCSFPRLWVPEIIGKFVILSTLGVVLVAMIVATTSINGYTGLTVIPIVVVMMLIPLLRLWILGDEIAGRHRKGAAWSG